jgi:predicted component of type VI protein secretion system
MKSELVPISGGTPIPIVNDVTVIGRREFCDVVIDHESLSKRHAVIVRTDGLLMVRDLASTNGTKVNGQRVMWAALLPNDRLTLGRCKFNVYLGSDEAPAPSEKGGAWTAAPIARPAPKAAAARSAASPRPAVGFPPPTPVGMAVIPPNVPGSTDPDAEIGELDEFLVDDEEEAFVIDLD